MKYWISPNSQSNLFAGEVSGGENYSNLFYTPQATYLPLLFLRQPISKLDTRALSLSPCFIVSNLMILTQKQLNILQQSASSPPSVGNFSST